MSCAALDGPRSPQTRGQWLRLVGNLANLSTPAGLAVAYAGRARVVRGPRGLWLAEGYRLPFPVAGAFTIGNVVVTASTWGPLLDRHPDLLAHEERHTWQYLYCLGLPYLLPYGVAMAWSVLRTGDRAAANVFERQAGLLAGGYRELPARPWRETLAALHKRVRRAPGHPVAD